MDRAHLPVLLLVLTLIPRQLPDRIYCHKFSYNQATHRARAYPRISKLLHLKLDHSVIGLPIMFISMYIKNESKCTLFRGCQTQARTMRLPCPRSARVRSAQLKLENLPSVDRAPLPVLLHVLTGIPRQLPQIIYCHKIYVLPGDPPSPSIPTHIKAIAFSA